MTGVHLGATDTDMMAGLDMDKNDPADVVRAALDGIEGGQLEVLVDESAPSAKAVSASTRGSPIRSWRRLGSRADPRRHRQGLRRRSPAASGA